MSKQAGAFPSANGGSDKNTAAARVMAFADHWRRLSNDSRMVVAAALLAALVAAAVVIIMWTSSDEMAPLYGHQESYDTAAIVEVLDAEGIKFDLDSRTGNVLVSKNAIASARMKLAARGVTAQMPAGMESLEGLSSLSTSQFMETTRYTYAIEGELARSILTLDHVRNARVHLAIPKRTLFVGREEQKPTASVILDLSRQLDETQIEAIANMVAASVSGMKPGAVSVVDQKGKLLSAGIGEDSTARASNRQMDYVTRLEEKIVRTAGAMLEPMLGAGNYRIRVSADVDFSQVDETRETLNNEPVLLSETTLTDSAAGQLALGIPGALTNQPPVAANNANNGDEENAANEGNGNEQAVNRREEVSRRYQTSKAITHTRNAEARVRKLSVSVLVNDGVAPDGAWAPAALEKVTDIVQTAAGLDIERGDTITVQSAPFVAAPVPDMTTDVTPWWQELLYKPEHIRYVVGFLLLLTLFFVGIRPLVRYLTSTASPRTTLPATRQRDSEDVDQAFSETEANGELVTEQDTGGRKPAANIGAAKTEPDHSSLNLPPPGSELEVQLEHLRLLADKETTRVAEVIRSWVNQSGHKTN
jgi:flagellar M-ring protein FliF